MKKFITATVAATCMMEISAEPMLSKAVFESHIMNLMSQELAEQTQLVSVRAANVNLLRCASKRKAPTAT